MQMKNNQAEPSFEEALETLDQVLEKLNRGDLPLEEAIGAYKEGMDMALICQKKLQMAEGELKILQEGFERAFSPEEMES